MSRQQTGEEGYTADVSRQETWLEGYTGDVSRQETGEEGYTGDVSRQETWLEGYTGDVSRQLHPGTMLPSRSHVAGSSDQASQLAARHTTSRRDTCNCRLVRATAGSHQSVRRAAGLRGQWRNKAV